MYPSSTCSLTWIHAFKCDAGSRQGTLRIAHTLTSAWTSEKSWFAGTQCIPVLNRAVAIRTTWIGNARISGSWWQVIFFTNA
jgi:hypothetical protein